ncbi:hypothetical protein [Brevibacillus reuszeri]|uniref:hypothetical protein n=1 Tax=Brevibacillus reuszeri TaxID=54915 RepID=UPI000CCC8AF9|nr:hypothetical protein [Brevibacillus reuszeri]
MRKQNQSKEPQVSVDVKKVLTKWAIKALEATPDFDIEEGATIQCNLDWDAFQKEIKAAHGWEGFLENLHRFKKKTDSFYSEGDLNLHEFRLLDSEIEIVYEKMNKK